LSPGFEPLFCPLPEEPDCCLSSFFVLSRIFISCFLAGRVNVINGTLYALLPRAEGAAIVIFVCLDAVTDNLASAMSAHRGQLVYRTLEAIENMVVSSCNYFKRKVIIVAADLTSCHPGSSRRF